MQTHSWIHTHIETQGHTHALTQTYMQTLRHMFSNTQIDTQRYIQRHIFTNIHSHRNTWTHSCTYKHRPMTYMHSDTCTQTHRDTYIDIYSQTHTHIETQGHTHALTQTYMQTLRHLYSNTHTGTHRYIHRHIFTNTLTHRCLHSHTRGNCALILADHPPQSPCHPLPPAGSTAPEGTALCKLGRTERPGRRGGLDARGATLSHPDCPWVWGPLKEPRGPLMSTQSTAGPRALMGPQGTGSGVVGQI